MARSCSYGKHPFVRVPICCKRFFVFVYNTHDDGLRNTRFEMELLGHHLASQKIGPSIGGLKKKLEVCKRLFSVLTNSITGPLTSVLQISGDGQCKI